VHLAVYNLSGDRVAVLVDGDQRAGEHKVRFEAAELPSGIYVCRLHTHDAVLTRKMLFVQ